MTMDFDKLPLKQCANYGSRHGEKITHLILHTTQGAWVGCVDWLLRPDNGIVSAHYVISKKGEIAYICDESLKADHACNANPFSIGIEHEGFINDPHYVTPEMWEVSTHLSAHLCMKYGIPRENIMPHSDPWLRQFGNNHKDVGPYFDVQKYRADVEAIIQSKKPIAPPPLPQLPHVNVLESVGEPFTINFAPPPPEDQEKSSEE